MRIEPRFYLPTAYILYSAMQINTVQSLDLMPRQMQYKVGMQLLQQGKKMINGSGEHLKKEIEHLKAISKRRHQEVQSSVKELNDMVTEGQLQNQTRRFPPLSLRRDAVLNFRPKSIKAYGHTASSSADTTVQRVSFWGALFILSTALYQTLSL